MSKKISILLAFITAFIYAVPARALEDIELVSETAVLMDADTGQILYNKDMDKRMYPASITKIMTAMLALENADESDKIIMSHDAVFSIGRGTSHIALDENEEITLEQALYALAMESANDAANGIAEHVGGTMTKFADMMNEKASQLGASNTHFVNAHGLHDEDHYTTALDMAKIAAAAIKTDGFCKYFTTLRYQIPPTNKQEETRYFYNNNKLVDGSIECEGLLMSKNGWTGEAKNTLVTAAERNGITLIAVVMKSGPTKDKFVDTANLLDWGYRNYSAVTVSADTICSSVPASVSGTNDADELSYGRFDAPDVRILLPKESSESDIKLSFSPLELNGDKTAVSTLCTIMLGGSEITGITPIEVAAEVFSKEQPTAETKEQGGQFSMIWVIIIALVVILAAAIIACFYIRAVSIRKRNRERRRARRIERMSR